MRVTRSSEGRRRDSGFTRRSARQRSGERVGGSNSVVESQPSKLLVAGSIPVSRSSLRPLLWQLAVAKHQKLSIRDRHLPM